MCLQACSQDGLFTHLSLSLSSPEKMVVSIFCHQIPRRHLIRKINLCARVINRWFNSVTTCIYPTWRVTHTHVATESIFVYTVYSKLYVLNVQNNKTRLRCAASKIQMSSDLLFENFNWVGSSSSKYEPVFKHVPFDCLFMLVGVVSFLV